MTRGEVRWRPPLPTAVITGVGSWLNTLSATIWMPRTLASQYAHFGSFGLGLAFVTWFTGLAFLIVVAAVIAPALTEGNDRFASWLRGGQPTALEPGAKPALPGPSRPMRLSDAFAADRKDPICRSRIHRKHDEEGGSQRLPRSTHEQVRPIVRGRPLTHVPEVVSTAAAHARRGSPTYSCCMVRSVQRVGADHYSVRMLVTRPPTLERDHKLRLQYSPHRSPSERHPGEAHDATTVRHVDRKR